MFFVEKGTRKVGLTQLLLNTLCPSMYAFSPLVSRRIATIVVLLGLLMWSIGFPGLFQFSANAATLTSISDTLSDSDLGVGSDHTISFTNPTAIAEGDTITITFEGEFNLSTSTAILGLEDFDVATGTGGVTELTLGYDCTAAEHWSVATSGQSITFTVCAGDGGSMAANATTTIQIGTNAASGGTGDTQIINAVEAGSYELIITTSSGDTGETRLAIIDDVVVTASVDTTFTFSISGLVQGVTVNGSPTTTATTTTATSIPFGTLADDTSYTAAQRLNVVTNATNGFVVTVEANQTLLSSTGADIDTFADGADTATPVAWAKPSGTLGAENTYGHWGVTSEDDLNTNEFGSDLWAGNFVGSARQIFENSGPADGATNNVGSTTVGYQVEISELQEAGSDYTATLTYVATPTF